MGGDEFAVLAPVESGPAAEKISRFLHRRFAGVLAETGHEVTCSVGALIVFPNDTRSSIELIREADRLMYIAKHEGRNRVRVALADDPASKESPIPYEARAT